jgi:hypothetical protein
VDIITYAATNGITVEDAKVVLEEMGRAGAPKGQNTTEQVFQANPRDYIPRDLGRGNHYAGRGAAQSWRRLPHLR